MAVLFQGFQSTSKKHILFCWTDILLLCETSAAVMQVKSLQGLSGPCVQIEGLLGG